LPTRIEPSADVASDTSIGDGTVIWHLAQVRKHAVHGPTASSDAATSYENEIVGFNARISDIHAAIGRAQLRKVRHWTTQRQANAAFYAQHLRGVVPPETAAEAVHVHHQYTVRVPEDRDGVAEALPAEHDVGTGLFYPAPTHRLPAFAAGHELPKTDRAAAEVLSLPVDPSLGPAELEPVVNAVNTVVRAGA
jgi:perosamine synthetase